MLRHFLVLLLSLATAAPAVAQSFSGAIRVVDADTIWVADIKVRLHGIDAPEVSQECELADGRPWLCGRWARDRVRVLYQGALTTCEQTDFDTKYNRVVARCRVDGQDIGQRLVRDGLAEAYRKYALDYVDAEKAAFFEGVGLWRGRVSAPAEFRAVSLQGPPPPDPGCRIKGNISANGHIYHMPGQAFYDRTVIRVETGERWFCTQDEAQAAGWRRAQR